jgi:hypothetical protein
MPALGSSLVVYSSYRNIGNNSIVIQIEDVFHTVPYQSLGSPQRASRLKKGVNIMARESHDITAMILRDKVESEAAVWPYLYNDNRFTLPSTNVYGENRFHNSGTGDC